MRSKLEVEIEHARTILEAMNYTIGQVEKYWPASKRGSNANREWERLKEQRGAALQCIIDAEGESNG